MVPQYIYLDLLSAISFRIRTEDANDLNRRRLGGTLCKRLGHLSMGEGIGGVRSESQFGAEDSLTLKTGTLPNE